jgi:hypothetical protein
MNHVQTHPETDPSSATSGIEAQYSRDDLRARIIEGLRAADKHLERLSINDLGAIDEFHLRGRAATTTSPTSLPSRPPITSWTSERGSAAPPDGSHRTTAATSPPSI